MEINVGIRGMGLIYVNQETNVVFSINCQDKIKVVIGGKGSVVFVNRSTGGDVELSDCKTNN